MRLACPNCDAKYEVPDDAIPEGGRDVQCSNCGNGWFQLRPEAEAAAEAEAALYGDDLPAPPQEPAAGPVFEPTPEAEPDPAAAAAPVESSVTAPVTTAAAPPPPPLPDEDEFDDEPAASPPAAAPATQALENSVLAVLREEAEREAEARRQEAQRAASRQAEAEGQLQTQPELGMDEAAAPAALSATQRRLAMLKGEDPDAPPPAPARPAARRDLLPNVDEINSTLQPGEDYDPDAAVDALPDLTRGNGFRTGFLLALFVLFVAAVIYAAAPSIRALVPALEGPLDAYVAFVDGLRLKLNEWMDAATNALNGTGG